MSSLSQAFILHRWPHFLAAITLLFIPAIGFGQSATPYQCAVRSLRALEQSFPNFVRMVHPFKGLVYQEAGKDINNEKPFSRQQLLAATKKNARTYPITASYEDEEIGRRVNIRSYLQTVVKKHPFSGTKDIRRNITGLAHSSDIFKKAGPGQTLISFHLANPAPDHELEWACLVVRTEVYKGVSYVIGIDYLYWTP